MAQEKKWRLVCYDVRDPKRYRMVHKLVLGAGRPVQFSVFRCRLDDRGLERLRWELERAMAPEDRLLIIDLCPRCAERVVDRAEQDGWGGEAPTHLILPALSARSPVTGNQASAAGEAPKLRARRQRRAPQQD